MQNSVSRVCSCYSIFKKENGLFSNLLHDLKEYITQIKEVVQNDENSCAHL
jgi:primosomal protein N''